jgi:cytochrome c553
MTNLRNHKDAMHTETSTSSQDVQPERMRGLHSLVPMRMSLSAALLLSSFGVCHPSLAAADTSEGIAFFEKKIRPVLVDKCYSCHAADAKKIKGGLLLDTREGIRNGGDTGPAVVPGDEKRSLLLTAIRYADKDFEMPPKEKLPPAVIEDFATWITMGAPDPREGKSMAKANGIDIEEGRKHWSFQPIVNPPVPVVKDTSWPRTDIDRFVLAALEAKGLKPVADAEPEVLRRRIAFDLTGLPPEGDQSAKVEFQIASLLASPRFGERWARHWLDVARYAESTGGGHNVLFPLAFRYRDWVIDSFNADKPYDQFIREQLAGDLLPTKSDAQRNAQLIATGFLGVGTKDLRERDTKRFRLTMADEQIDVTSRAFLGLTVACAKCHDHKFDPIPTRDYYALAGIFTSSEPMLGVRRVREKDPFASGVLSLAGTATKLTDDDVAGLLQQRVELTYARLKLRDVKYQALGATKLKMKKNQKLDPAAEAVFSASPEVQAQSKIVSDLEAKLAATTRRYETALPEAAMAMRDIRPADVAVHIRGEDAQLGEIAPRGFPQVLTTATTKPVNRAQSGRLELAQWIASAQHPLTARVMVNRIWQQLFGTGIVETPDDFGKTGQPPNNAALLDHLAQRFIAHGWSVKKMIAEIMQSRVYQLGTAHDAKAFELDPANRLHWRMDRRRLDSDAINDAIRQIGGTLVLTRPAPQIPPLIDDDRVKTMNLRAWRATTTAHRTIYQPVLRDYIPDDWSVFDFPDPELVTGKRGVTTVPTQALYLMNSPFIVEQSKQTAAKLMTRASGTDALIRDAYALILNRAPTPDEAGDASAMLASFVTTTPTAAVAALCQTLFATAEFRYLY